jgi:hypothetical protein
MTTLLINDLARTEELDRASMASVHGGSGGGYGGGYGGMPKDMMAYWGPSYSVDKDVFSFNASQAIGQTQNVLNNNGNNVAFASGITSTVNPTQSAHNNINF